MAEREEVFQQAMNQGHSAAWDQLWNRAARYYRKALEVFPDHPKALTSLGLALYELQEFGEALGCYQRAAEVAPNDPIPLEKMAQIHERLGNIEGAAQIAMRAAEVYLSGKDVNKALENYIRVTQLFPNHLPARVRLAMIHERLGHKERAVTEYLAVAAIYQHGGQIEKALQSTEHALKVLPNNEDAKKVLAMVKANQMLPNPERPRGGTAPLRMAKVRQLGESEVEEVSEGGVDPVASARNKALTVLAGILFEQRLDDDTPEKHRGLLALTRGEKELNTGKIERTKIFMHLGQAVDLQTRGEDTRAVVELERAIGAGLQHPAAYFDFGMLLTEAGRLESAQRYLQRAIIHPDYALGAHLLLGQVFRRMNRWREASAEYLEALKIADVQVVPLSQADALRQLYDPIIEEHSRETDEQVHRRLCENISLLLLRPDWQDHVVKARAQIPGRPDSELPVPLVELMTEVRSSQVITQLSHIKELARDGYMRTAMEEAFYALQTAPTYLPLHIYMGELLLQQDRTEAAVEKFNAIAHAYQVRGDTDQSKKLLHRVVELSPLDLDARQRLINILVDLGQIDEAISEFIDLAESYYRLAELGAARKTYTQALDLAQRSNADRAWRVQIMHHMADIDMQRLSWRQAMRVYEQIRSIQPNDELARTKLIELNYRLGQKAQAIFELDNFIEYLTNSGQQIQAIEFLERVVNENPDQPELRQRLVDMYLKVGRTADAISQLDALGEMLRASGNTAGAIKVVQTILGLNPPSVEGYRDLLRELRGE
ncbi:MAG: tetratricopeptide repeat protein [Chloroflexota bacterium]